jgi:CheY-like chemotaxis protein
MQNHNPAQILLVDHSEHDILLIRRTLQRATLSCSIHVVRSGEEALAYLKGKAEHQNGHDHPFPDLLLLDVYMPGTSASEVVRWVRQRPCFSSLIIVALTPSNDFWHLTEAYRSGADSFMVKPADPRDLLQLGLTLHWLQKTQPARMSEALLPPAIPDPRLVPQTSSRHVARAGNQAPPRPLNH